MELALVDEVGVVQVVHGVDEHDAGRPQALDPLPDLGGAEVLEAEVEVHDVHADGDERVDVPDRRRSAGGGVDEPEPAEVRVVGRVLGDPDVADRRHARWSMRSANHDS